MTCYTGREKIWVLPRKEGMYGKLKLRNEMPYSGGSSLVLGRERRYGKLKLICEMPYGSMACHMLGKEYGKMKRGVCNAIPVVNGLRGSCLGHVWYA